MKKLVLETTAPFQGLPELVADARACSRRRACRSNGSSARATTRGPHVNVNSPKGLNPFSSHGKMLEQGKADMYNACEWGNYCRVQDTQVGSRQVGRRGIVTYAAIVVRPDSPVFTGAATGRQDGRRAVLLRHALSRAASARRLHAARGDQALPHLERLAPRFDAMMRGEIEATTLTEPYVTLAEKKGCRLICAAFYHGTEVASDRVDAETYGAFNRAVREAVQAHQRRQGEVSPLLHRLPREEGPRDRARSSRRTCAPAASWCAIRRRSRSTRCSAPTSG